MNKKEIDKEIVDILLRNDNTVAPDVFLREIDADEVDIRERLIYYLDHGHLAYTMNWLIDGRGLKNSKSMYLVVES